MSDAQPRFLNLAAKTAVCHTLTYFVMGVFPITPSTMRSCSPSPAPACVP